MDRNNTKKKEQLGISAGTACGRLKKALMYDLAKKLNLHYCFQCNQEIKVVEQFTIEHKVPWLDSKNPKELFFSLDNIAFSHHSCNVRAARKCNLGQRTSEHGTIARYGNPTNCRCEKCTEAMKLWKKKRREITNKI